MRWIIFFLAASPLHAAEKLSVGFGECDVTPALGKKPVYLAGFMTDRTATKVHDPIMARAIVLNDGNKTIAMVSVDVIGLFLPTIDRVRAELKGFDFVLVSSTHNHEGPDTIGLWGKTYLQSGVDPDYLKRVEEGIVTAVRAAEKSLAPANAKIGTTNAPDLLHDARLPIVKHDELVAIRFESPAGKTVGVLVQWNCHPETLDDKNREVSADFVGYTVKHVAEKYSCPAIYFTGTVGGLLSSLKVPIRDGKGVELKDGTFEKTAGYGIAVGKIAEKALEKAVDVKLIPFEVRTQQVLVPVENGLYKIASQLDVLQRPFYLWEGTPIPKEFVVSKDVKKPVGVKTEVGYLKLGSLDVALLPGEIYPELVVGGVQDPPDAGADFPDAPIEPLIYAGLKNKHKMLIGLANDELGYFIPKRQWDVKPPYCYKLKESQYGEINSCGPDAAKVICEAFRTLVEKK
jgi:hypothetical protein